MSPELCCSICGKYYGRNGNAHRCDEKFLEHRERGLSADREMGVVRNPSWGVRLSDGFKIGHSADGEG